MNRFHQMGCVLMLVIASSAPAHPFSTTLAEVELNEKTHRLEIALRVPPEPLEKAISLHAKEQVSLELSKDVDRMIVEYLSTRISIQTKSDAERTADKAKPKRKPTPLTEIKWIGKEVGPKEVWLYFEIPFEGSLEGARVRNSILTEISKEQINTLNFKSPGKEASCTVNLREPEQVVHLRQKGVKRRERIQP